MLSSEIEKLMICRLSHPGQPHTLSRRAGKDTPAGCYSGGETPNILTKLKHFHYYCTTCDVEFHDGCHLSPRKMTHPYHPQHPLIFSVLNPKARIIHASNIHKCYGMGTNVHDDLSIPNHGNTFDKCTWCGRSLKNFAFFYRCSVCTFCLDPSCSKTFPLPTIIAPKSHHHSLNFLPRPLLLPCDACGVVKIPDPSYTCFQCNYVVHESCIDLPRVIKITRHPHRLFHTPFLSPQFSLCRICYKTVDIKYGQYSCSHDDCTYVVHSKCATHKKVWDGSELEWDPEDSGETTEDIEPFKKVSDGLIKYFCHEHHLNLEKYDGVRDAEKQCQACVLHIDSRDFYNCVQCDFFLHEVCANLPRKIDHAIHHHPLFLDPSPSDDYKFIDCLVCSRPFSGFRYKCSKNNCEVRNHRKFQVDVRCILVPDCFTHKSHEHPLFIPIFDAKFKIFCNGCGHKCSGNNYLQCTLLCKFAVCFKCATIPDQLHQKCDALPLSLCYGEVSDETYWCEVCEKELDPSRWFYTCNKTYTTVHSSCVFGKSSYMKPGYKFYKGYLSVIVICNSSNTRPICYGCDSRCKSYVYLRFNLRGEKFICSFRCFGNVL